MLPSILLLSYIILGVLWFNSIAQLVMMIIFDIGSNSSSTVKSTENEENTRLVEVSNIVDTFLQCLHVIEYLLLIISLSKLMVHNKDKFTLTCKDCCSTLFGCIHSNLKIQCKVILTVLSSLFFTILIFLPPTLYTIYYQSHDVKTVAFNVLIFVAHFSNWIIRITLMLMTIKVISRWKTAIQEISDCSNPQSLSSLSEKYTSAGDDACLFKEVFQPWFVVQWIIYFTPIMVNFILIFNSSGQKQTLYISYTIYNFSAFIFPYICGITMNYYHKKCHRKIRTKLKDLLSQNTKTELWQNVDLIPKSPDFNFVPSFFGIIDIPINTTGHALTIFLTLTSFLLSLLNNIISKQVSSQ